MSSAVHLVQTFEAAAALMSAARLRLLSELVEPDSAAGLARRVDLPRQQVNYHLRELERAGLVQFVEERRKGNCVERIVRAAARSYVISPEVLGQLGRTPEEQQDRFSLGYLVALAARIIRDLGALRNRAEKEHRRVSTLAIESEIRFADAASRSAFAAELTDAMARLTAKYHQSTGRAFRIIAAAYPSIRSNDATHVSNQD